MTNEQMSNLLKMLRSENTDDIKLALNMLKSQKKSLTKSNKILLLAFTALLHLDNNCYLEEGSELINQPYSSFYDHEKEYIKIVFSILKSSVIEALGENINLKLDNK